jgi:hypothetical protein
MRSLVLWVSVLLAAPATAASSSPIRGDYIEDRSNHVYGCYCEWSGESQTGGREAVLAWSIDEGAYAGTPLRGVRMAAVIVGERTLSLGDAPRKSILVLDSAAGEAQRKAAEALLRSRYRALLGEVIGVRSLPIRFRKGAEDATLAVGDAVKIEMRRASPKQDGMLGAVLWFDPFIALEESTVGTTLEVRYSGSDFDHRWQRTVPEMTGYFGRFKLE